MVEAEEVLTVISDFVCSEGERLLRSKLFVVEPLLPARADVNAVVDWEPGKSVTLLGGRDSVKEAGGRALSAGTSPLSESLGVE